MSIISMILFLHPGYPGEMRFSGNTSPLSHRDSDGERGPLRSSCVTLVLHFARISNVDSVMFVNGITKMVSFEPVKEIEKDVFVLSRAWDKDTWNPWCGSVVKHRRASECGIRALPSSLSFILFLSSVVQIRLLEILSLLILLTTSTTTVSTSTRGYQYSPILLLFILLFLRPLSSQRLLLLLFALIKFSDWFMSWKAAWLFYTGVLIDIISATE